jgi:hypothetical protein
MILPNVGLGGAATIEKARAAAAAAKKNLTVAVNAATSRSYERSLWIMDSRGDARSRAHELLARAAKTEFLADIDKLNASVDSGRRVLGIPQLLLAHADRFEHGRIDVERIDQGIADRLGAALTQAHIVLATADGIGVTDHQKSIAEQNGVVQGVGNGADRPV